MPPGLLRAYSYFSAGTYPTEKKRGVQMYHDFDHGLARERMVQMRKTIEHNRLEASLARAALSNEVSVTRRGRVARGAALLTALFR